jgi:cell division protein FtsW
MAVNVGLLPAKGMTLPFISYGGSSMLAMALTMGFVLGLTRKRPMAGRLPRSAASEADAESAAGARAGKAASEQVA